MNVRYSITLKSEKLTNMKMLMGCKPELQRQYNNTVARLKGYRTLEPYEAKVSRTVLKGLETGNGLRLLNNASDLDLPVFILFKGRKGNQNVRLRPKIQNKPALG